MLATCIAAFALILLQEPDKTAAPAGPIVAGKLAEAADLYLARCVPFGFSGSVLAVQGDQVILKRGYGIADPLTGAACTPGTLFDLGSLTKQLTAAAVLRLEQEKRLKVTDTLERFFKDAPKDKRSIELHHLLTHTSGLPRGLPQVGSRMTDRAAFIEAVMAAPLASKPGAQHVYSNLGYDLLAAVVEIAAEKPFEEALRELLFEPAGMTSTGFRQDGRLDPLRAARGTLDTGDPPPQGSLVEGRPSRSEAPEGDERTLATEGWYSWGLRGAGGVLSTVEDQWRWEEALRGDALLGKAARAKLFEPFRDNYAYGWYVQKSPRGTPWIEHGGSTGNGFEAKFTRYPKERVFFTVLGNSTGVVPWVNLNLGKILFGDECPLPPATVALSADSLASLAGEYEGAGGFRARLFVHAGSLVLEAASESAFDLLSGPSADKSALKRSREIVAGFARDDFVPLHAAENKQFPLFFMESWWQDLLGHHGPLARSTVLGASAERTGGTTVVALLEFERGAELFKLQWGGGALTGVNIGSPYPNRVRLVPEAETSFVAYDLVAQRVVARATRGAGEEWELQAGERVQRFTRAAR